ncbi:hypothetical protein PoB_005591600 [Plakobranchus ocellatus]|uniref:Uncharacterized protein n=1 Tax=Plakobranchus ocellatus TaxID=259542 RepID=A0AAV4C225_9GAST|nr:hypothetical protein PoB_005591600 [Plakobranchus ocellatus]
MSPPQNQAELRTVCGIFNYLTEFVKNMAGTLKKKHRSADTLTRQPVAHTAADKEMETGSDLKIYVESVMSSFPVIDQKLEKLKSEIVHGVELQ